MKWHHINIILYRLINLLDFDVNEYINIPIGKNNIKIINNLYFYRMRNKRAIYFS